MTILLSDPVPAESTAGIEVSFYDEDGVLVTPNSVTWTLLNSLGSTVNARQNVDVDTPASTVTIVLYGDDLRYADGKTRYLLVDAVYSSDLGAALPLRNEIVFTLKKLVEPD